MALSKDTKCFVFSKSQNKDIEVTIRRFDTAKGKYFVQRADGRYLWYTPDALKMQDGTPAVKQARKTKAKASLDSLVDAINSGALDRNQIQESLSDL